MQLVYRAAGKKQKSIFTPVPDTPDLLRAKQGQKLQSQVRLDSENSETCHAGVTEDGYVDHSWSVAASHTWVSLMQPQAHEFQEAVFVWAIITIIVFYMSR